MKIWLLRHASAEVRAPSGRDQDRRLTAAGRATCHELQAWIRDSGHPVPARVLVSPAQRTLETARTVLGHLDVPAPVIDDRLWNATVGDLVALLDQADEPADAIMLIAHNPGLEDLAGWLGGRLPVVGMKAGSLCILDTPRPLTPGQASTVACFQPSESR
ncbi:MAG: SixA phosphatase family protein [Wenzhouxiangella sp.]